MSKRRTGSVTLRSMHKHREVQEVKWRINEMNLFYFESVQLTCWLRHGTRSPPPTPPTVRNLSSSVVSVDQRAVGPHSDCINMTFCYLHMQAD